MDEVGAHHGAGVGQVARRHVIHEHALLCVRFGTVHCRIGCEVDDDVRRRFADNAVNIGFVRHV